MSNRRLVFSPRSWFEESTIVLDTVNKSNKYINYYCPNDKLFLKPRVYVRWLVMELKGWGMIDKN